MSFNDRKSRNVTRFMVEDLPPTANLSSACYQGYIDNKQLLACITNALYFWQLILRKWALKQKEQRGVGRRHLDMHLCQTGKDEVNKMQKAVNFHMSAKAETKQNCCSLSSKNGI